MINDNLLIHRGAVRVLNFLSLVLIIRKARCIASSSMESDSRVPIQRPGYATCAEQRRRAAPYRSAAPPQQTPPLSLLLQGELHTSPPLWPGHPAGPGWTVLAGALSSAGALSLVHPRLWEREGRWKPSSSSCCIPGKWGVLSSPLCDKEDLYHQF